MRSYVFIDVFDCILTRNVYKPRDIFLRVQNRLLADNINWDHSDVIHKFQNIRKSAELEARSQLTGREEITFDEIVSITSQKYCLNEERSLFLASIEINEEINSITPVGSVLSLIRAMRIADKRIVFISDMYFPEKIIREMLQHVGVLEHDDDVYVSSSIGKKKSTGSLFQHVLDDLHLQPKQVIHIGDYLWSDYLVPRLKCGIRSIPVRIARNNIYEHLLGEPCHCLYCSSVAGASRAARLTQVWDGVTSVDTALYNMGCNVLGPILGGFILWVLQQAAQSGIRRLYFLSRDGEVLLDFARELAGRLGIEIELRYLYVSRTAVFPALLGTDVNDHTIEWLKEDTIILTVRILADRLKVDAVSMFELLQHAGVCLKGLDAPLERRTLDKIYSLLVKDPALREIIRHSGDKVQQNLSGYLEQELFFDGTPSGLVDLGWHGGIQDVISACFAERLGTNGISGYYFGIDLPGKPANRKSGYFFNHCEQTEIHRYRHFFRVVLELLCSGSHGMVRNYCDNTHGSVEPIFDAVEHLANWERIKYIRQGAMNFLKHLDTRSVGGVDYQHMRPQILSVLKKFFFFPSKDEALALGGLRFSADQAGHGLHQVAPPLSVGSAIRYLAMRSYSGRSSISSWFFASWRCSKVGTRLIMYPLVLLLRICFGGADFLRFSRMKAVDIVNNLISINKISI